MAKVSRDGREEGANILFGRSPSRGSIHPEYEMWDGSKEPLFTSAMTVVGETMERNKDLRVESGALLPAPDGLHAALVRHRAVRLLQVSPGEPGGREGPQTGEDPTFIGALHEAVNERREVFRSDDPKKKVVLDRDDPRKALAYYYQIRSNITHRGKTAVRDHEMLLRSLTELHGIFQQVLWAEFSASDPHPDGDGKQGSDRLCLGGH